jgi:hypothetical protein
MPSASLCACGGEGRGGFQFSPAEHLYPRFLKEMVTYMKEPGEKKFAMQYLLHKVFGNSYFCLSQVRACDDGSTHAPPRRSTIMLASCLHTNGRVTELTEPRH